VPERDYNTLAHLHQVLHDTDTEQRDIVVITVRLMVGPDAGSRDIDREELFTDYEQQLFTRVVSIAVRQGRSVKLLVVPSINVFDAIAQTAVRLEARDIVLGESAKMAAADQARLLGEAWDRTPRGADLGTRLTVYLIAGSAQRFSLGAHAPELSIDDVERIHRLWLDAVKAVGPGIHHRDVVSAALGTFEDELGGSHREEAIARLRQEVGRS
jgi:hypothetical protein